MKTTRFFIAASFVIAIGGAVIGKANIRFTDARYKDSTSSTCSFPVSLPAGCGVVGSSLCTTGVSPSTRSYYQDASCALPYFRN